MSSDEVKTTNEPAESASPACKEDDKAKQLFDEAIMEYVEVDPNVSPPRAGFYVLIVNTSEVQENLCTPLGRRILALSPAQRISFERSAIPKIIIEEHHHRFDWSESTEDAEKRLSATPHRFLDLVRLPGFDVHLLKCSKEFGDYHMVSICPVAVVEEMESLQHGCDMETVAWMDFTILLEVIDERICRDEDELTDEQQVLQQFRDLWYEASPILLIYLNSRVKLDRIVTSFEANGILAVDDEVPTPLSQVSLRIRKDDVDQFRTDQFEVLREADCLHAAENTETTFEFIEFEAPPEPMDIDEEDRLQVELKVHSISIPAAKFKTPEPIDDSAHHLFQQKILPMPHP